MDKIYISGDELLLDSFRLAEQIYRSGFRPDILIGVWRGGTPVAIAVQEYFEYMQQPSDHIAIRTTSYTGIGQQNEQIQVHGLEYLVRNARPEDKLLIIDDVFDSGRSIQAVLRALMDRTGESMPRVIKTAMPWYKPKNNRTDLLPDYYIHTTDKWLVFPHELAGLTAEEIRKHKGSIADTLAHGEPGDA